MELQLSSERHAQLADYAYRHGQDPAAALDDILADALEWECLDYREAIKGIERGYTDMKADRTPRTRRIFRATARQAWRTALDKPIRHIRS